MQTTPHPYADILRAIADGKSVQVNTGGSSWETVGADSVLMFLRQTKKPTMRIKPEMMFINGFEVPCPLKEEPQMAQRVFIPGFLHFSNYQEQYWQAHPRQLKMLRQGLLHASCEDAIAHAKALLSFTDQS